MVSVSPAPIETDEQSVLTMERLALREQAAQPLLNSGWTLLYSGLTPLRASVTLLDPSESLQISLQIPIGEVDKDWDLWLEACNRQLSAPLRQWLESQGIEQTTLSRLTGAEQGGEEPLKISNMLQMARWLQSPIEAIEALAESNGSQLVLHLAGLGTNS
ncbi:hypothetical protein SynA18461_01775 [Synechococcus sp. A18-46.1]|nr:hypothetical protein SynA18461_01775 [Synechococcus sp. A18-46.1]